MTQAQQPEDGYSEVVHHANVSSSLAYVARKTGFGFQKTERLLELALQRGDLAEGDYSGRKLGRYHDDRARALEAENERLRAQLASEQQDAARYRWVREQAEFFPLVMDGTGLLCAEHAEAEAEIDAAIAAAPEEHAP